MIDEIYLQSIGIFDKDKYSDREDICDDCGNSRMYGYCSFIFVIPNTGEYCEFCIIKHLNDEPKT